MMENEEIEKLTDVLYNHYECENSLQNTMYIHPMFYNETFSENNEYQPPKPEKLMSREEFELKLNSEPLEYRWNTALLVLYNYVSKQIEK